MKAKKAPKKTKKTMKKKAPARKPKNKITATHVTIVLDESGSMGIVRDATIESFNSYITDLKAQKADDCFVTLQTFDTRGFRYRFEKKDLEKVSLLLRDDYQPNAGTPLYDAVMDGIASVERSKKNNEGIFFVIQTDGEENSSIKNTQKDVFDKITEKQKEGWVFLFLGANQDAWTGAGKIGILHANTISYDNTARGIHSTQKAVSSSIGSYRFGVDAVKYNMASNATGSESGLDLREENDISGTFTGKIKRTKDTD